MSKRDEGETGGDPDPTVSRLERRRQKAENKAGERYSRRSKDVLEAAAQLFADQGYAATSLADIASVAGMDRATLYYYYKSKADVFRAAITGVIENNIEDFHAIAAADDDPETKIRGVIARLVEVFETGYPYTVLFFTSDLSAFVADDVEWGRETVRTERVIEGLIEDIIEEGQTTGVFRNDIDAGLLVKLVMSVNWTHRWFRPDEGLTGAEVADAYEKLLLQGLLTEEATPAG